MATKQTVIYSSSDDEPDLGRFQTKKTKNKKILKKKIDINSNNDMTKSTLMKTLPNSTEDLLHLCGEGAIPHNITIKRWVESNPPTYTRNTVCIKDSIEIVRIDTARKSRVAMVYLVVLWNCRIIVVRNLIY